MVEQRNEFAARGSWSVTALLLAVADSLAARFTGCSVQGELSSLSRAASGHFYFSLKDANGGAGTLRCAMFRRASSLLDFAAADGQLVEVRGRLAVYEPRGELQFVVESMRRFGAGALYEQLLRLRAQLQSQGLFDTERKRAVAKHPRCIAVVSSLAAAALQDVLTTLARRSPQVQVLVFPTLVQGAEAPTMLVSALQRAGRHPGVDTLILCRGGGSLEDLWAFNDERVVRAVAASPVPVVCGVGHETDITLCDLAADLRAATPTAAAELAAPEAKACRAQLDTSQSRLQRRLRAALDVRAQGLDGVTLRLARPADGVQSRRHAIELASQRLRGAARHLLDRDGARLAHLSDRMGRAGIVSRTTEQRRLDHIEARLRLLDPARVLARGYAWLTDARGAVVQSVQALAPGDALQARLADGQVDVQVIRVAGLPMA